MGHTVQRVNNNTSGMDYYYKLWGALKKALADEDELGCHANSIVVELGKSIESQYTYYNAGFDGWLDYFLK